MDCVNEKGWILISWPIDLDLHFYTKEGIRILKKLCAWCTNYVFNLTLDFIVICWKLLQTVLTQIRTDTTLVLIWNQPNLHSDSLPERFFWKSQFWKKSADDNKIWNITQHVNLTLKAPIATKVIYFSRLLKCLRSLHNKQWGPRSDCSYRSSLIWVHPVCFYAYISQ